MSDLPSPPLTTSIVWSYKPWWCQPWSITLTGFSTIALSWIIFHRSWVTGLVAFPVLSWMGYFLLVYPKLFAQLYGQSQSSTIAGDLDTPDDRST